VSHGVVRHELSTAVNSCQAIHLRTQPCLCIRVRHGRNPLGIVWICWGPRRMAGDYSMSFASRNPLNCHRASGAKKLR
jgi:hypothetical protein